ncbi:Histone deacetylase complex subunit SAP18 [Hypsizygus marmoreus]|uniref:Histone deacetylase complex subunit SAP18 n=1 Tax=Hypsizygus marmoreus TaxID=39966 RepID=A0A369JDI3_HYPMA|nr:Histone deacetylase complex subunit SAP18 [Hypsizygus marmoreus]
MDVETTTPAGQPIVPREKTAPFLIRTFVKIGSFHRLTLFEDGTLPTTDEQQLFTWKDATLREVLTTLRNTAPLISEYRHPLARFSFRTVYADSANKGRFSQKDLGMVYSRDILGEPGTLNSTAPRLREDNDGEAREPSEREREERTLDELRFVPGDYLLIAVLLPKSVTVPTEIAIKGSAGAGAPATSNGWRSAAGAPPGRGGDSGWGGSVAPSTGPGAGRGGGHWRGDSNAPPPGGRGRGGRGGGDFGRDRDVDRSDRRVPPPRRSESPPTRGRGGWGARGRGGRGGRRSRSRSRSRSRTPSRSRSPPRRRRYD